VDDSLENGGLKTSTFDEKPPNFESYINVVITSHGFLEPKNVFKIPANIRLITFNQKGQILATHSGRDQNKPINYSVSHPSDWHSDIDNSQYDIEHSTSVIDRSANRVMNSLCGTTWKNLMAEHVSYKWDPGMSVENIVYRVDSTDIQAGIAICNKNLNGFYKFTDIIDAFKKRYPISGNFISLYHIIALLPGIIPGYKGEFINLFSFSCMGYRGQQDNNRHVIMDIFPAPYSNIPYSNFGKASAKSLLKYIKYIEKTFKV
jgi:hypothetical protein